MDQGKRSINTGIGLGILLGIVGICYLLISHQSGSPAPSPTSTEKSTASSDNNIDGLVDEGESQYYRNVQYGFLLPLPKKWKMTAEDVNGNSHSKGESDVFYVSFKDSEEQVPEGPFTASKLYVRVSKKGDFTNLSDWLIHEWRNDGELANYKPGKAITLGGYNGLFSNTSCCVDYDVSYVVENGEYVYSLGVEKGGAGVGETDDPTLKEIAPGFAFAFRD